MNLGDFPTFQKFCEIKGISAIDFSLMMNSNRAQLKIYFDEWEAVRKRYEEERDKLNNYNYTTEIADIKAVVDNVGVTQALKVIAEKNKTIRELEKKIEQQNSFIKDLIDRSMNNLSSIISNYILGTKDWLAEEIGKDHETIKHIDFILKGIKSNKYRWFEFSVKKGIAEKQEKEEELRWTSTQWWS